jgi:hypothetical protein
MRGITDVYDEGKEHEVPFRVNGPCSDKRVYLKMSLDNIHE